MEYEDRVLAYLEEMKPGQKVEIAKIATVPERFINAIKYLIDNEYVMDIEFSGNYKYVRRMWNF